MSNRVRNLAATVLLFMLSVFLAGPAHAKSSIDLNPNLDFTQYKTFAFIGGVQHLDRLQLNPNEIRDVVHGSVSRALTARGLKEVQRDQNPDLVVRYLVETNTQINFSGEDDWGGYDMYTADWWSQAYTVWLSSTTRQGALMIDLIDAKRRDLAWRLFLQQQILNVDKLPEKVDKEITKGFESFPPSEKDKEEVRKEHAKQATRKQKPDFQ